MSAIPIERLMEILLEMLAEAYEGPQKPYSWFTDNRPDAGLFGSLAGLSATQASEPASPGGTTIAAHVEHLRWSLALANEFIRGGQPRPNWEESWSVREVDPATWEGLQDDLRQEYDTLRQVIVTHAMRTDWSHPQILRGTMALVPHAAYHLGAIRQMIRNVKGRSTQAQ